MTSPCVCRLNGLDPRDLDPALVVVDIIEHAPAVERKTASVAGRNGSRVTKARLGSLSVSVRFELHDLDPARRRHLCRALARWAAPGGMLTLGDRPGQQLRVVCDAPPVIGSTMGWTQPVTVRFTAWDTPFWEAEAATSAHSSTAKEGTVLLRPGGDLPVPMEAQLRNASQSIINSVAVSDGEQIIRLSGLAMAPGEVLVIDHDERALIRMVLRGADGSPRSVLALREAESDDEIIIDGQRTARVSFSADAEVIATFSARARWL